MSTGRFAFPIGLLVPSILQQLVAGAGHPTNEEPQPEAGRAEGERVGDGGGEEGEGVAGHLGGTLGCQMPLIADRASVRPKRGAVTPTDLGGRAEGKAHLAESHLRVAHGDLSADAVQIVDEAFRGAHARPRNASTREVWGW